MSTIPSASGVTREAVLDHLGRVLSSASFQGADRSTTLLRFLVERTLDGGADRLKEYTVGCEGLARGAAFDPRTDPIVRAEVSRLRNRLERYYASDGRDDTVVIELPKGTYVPQFRVRSPDAGVSGPAAGHAPSDGAVGRRRRLLAWALAGSLAMAMAFAAGVWVARRSAPAIVQPPMHVDVQLQSAGVVGSEVSTDVVLSPDGSRVVFVSMDSAGVSHLRSRRFDGSGPTDLAGTDGARGPFWSPDGHWIGFWAAGQLRKVAVDGGSPVVLCDATDLLGASWGDDGTIVAALDATRRLWRVNASGGTPKVAIDLTMDTTTGVVTGMGLRWPQLLPGGRVALYTALTALGADRANVEAVSLTDGRRHVLVKGGTFGRYIPPGYLIFVNQGALYAIRFDVRRLETRGAAVPIIDDVAYSPTFGYAQLSISAGGVMAYRRAAAGGRATVALLDSAGRWTPLLGVPRRYTWPALSPDGRRLALSVTEDGVQRIHIFANVDDPPARRVSSVAGFIAPAWTRDSRFLVVGGPRGLAWTSADGGAPHSLLQRSELAVPWSVAADGRRLAFASVDPKTAFDLWIISFDETPVGLRAGPAEPFLQSPFFETYPTISPDGQWLAYSSNASGSWEVYVRSIPDHGAPVQVSREGGRMARWAKTGHRLYFGTADQRIMVASYSVSGGRFIAGVPRQWTPVRLADTGVFPNFDLTPDDRHVVALLPAASPNDGQIANHVTLIWNFADELRARLP